MTMAANSRSVDLRLGPVPVGRASPRDGARGAAENNLFIRNTHLSKEHARVWASHDGVFVEDTCLTFGTVLNNMLLLPHHPAALHVGDVLGFIVNRPLTVIEKIRQAGNPVALDLISNPRVRLQYTVARYEDQILELQPLADTATEALTLVDDVEQTPEVREQSVQVLDEMRAAASVAIASLLPSDASTSSDQKSSDSQSVDIESGSEAPVEEPYVKEVWGYDCGATSCCGNCSDGDVASVTTETAACLCGEDEQAEGFGEPTTIAAHRCASCEECEACAAIDDGCADCKGCDLQGDEDTGGLSEVSEDDMSEDDMSEDDMSEDDGANQCAGECGLVVFSNYEPCEKDIYFREDYDSEDDETYTLEFYKHASDSLVLVDSSLQSDSDSDSDSEQSELVCYDLSEFEEIVAQIVDCEGEDYSTTSQPVPSSRKRTREQADLQEPDEVSDPGERVIKKRKLMLGTLLKEAARGVLYAAGTILALAAYGSYLEQRLP